MFKTIMAKSKAFIVFAVAGTPAIAFANFDDEEFGTFKDSIASVITGNLGRSVALIALLLGGLIGLAKSSAWPALTGLAIAAVFGLGPFLIETIFNAFSVIG